TSRCVTQSCKSAPLTGKASLVSSDVPLGVTCNAADPPGVWTSSLSAQVEPVLSSPNAERSLSSHTGHISPPSCASATGRRGAENTTNATTKKRESKEIKDLRMLNSFHSLTLVKPLSSVSRTIVRSSGKTPLC